MTPRQPPSDDQLREAFSEVGDALQRAVVLSSDRVQSVFEDAVLRGRMTRRDAEELAASIVALGRDQAQELRGEVDALARSIPTIPAKVADAVDPRSKRRKKRQRDDEQDAARREAARFVSAEAFTDRAPEPAAPGSATPADAPGSAPNDPSKLTVKEIVAMLPTLSPDALQALRTREAAGKGRATVLKAVDQRL